MERRTFIAGALLYGVAAGSPAAAQSSPERREVESFLRGLLGAARSGRRAPVEQFIRQHVDLQYGYDVVFAPVADAVSQDQRNRLFDLMVKFTSMEVLVLADYVNKGRLEVGGTRQVKGGTVVDVTFTGQHGRVPLSVLVARPGVGGRLMVRDMGSPNQLSVMTRLARATSSLAQTTPDPEVWISSFEQVLAGTG